MRARHATAETTRRSVVELSMWATVGSGILVIIAGTLLARSITRPLEGVAAGAEAIRRGDLSRRIDEEGDDEIASLARSFNRMAASLSAARDDAEATTRLRDDTAGLVQRMQGHLDVEAFAAGSFPSLLSLLGGLQAAFFVSRNGEDEARFDRVWTHASDPQIPTTVRAGEGLVGEVATTKTALFVDGGELDRADEPAMPVGFRRLRTSLADTTPAAIAIVPFLSEGRTLGLLEIATARPLDPRERVLLTNVAEVGGVLLKAFRATAETTRLLRETQDLADELQKQTEELHSLNQQVEEKNRFLEDQRTSLEGSELTLREQQDELQALNEELEEQATLVNTRNVALERKNEELEAARSLIETKVEELRLSAQFKSQFLANVSHELRTPLNSQLILSRLLQENTEGNLTTKQRDYLRTIHRSGMELLRLVDDILDLAKIEAGRLEIQTEQVDLATVLAEMEANFREIALRKGLTFVVHAPAENVPPALQTDGHRLRQILKNLIGNAIKFTERGGVVVELVATAAGQDGPRPGRVAFHVRDTGIGLSIGQQAHVFEAFRQADGSISRTYGGTGLGLSISRELATLLGGEISVESSLGAGSVFTLVVGDAAPSDGVVRGPIAGDHPPATTSSREPEPSRTSDEATLREALIITNDDDFAASAAAPAAESGFSLVRVAYDGQAHATVRGLSPSAVVLAVDGRDMETASLLRADLDARRIPVHFVGSLNEPRRALAEIALFLHRIASSPSGRPLPASATAQEDPAFVGKCVLLVDDDMRNIFALTAVLEREGLRVRFAEDGEQALLAMDQHATTDAVLMDVMMPKLDGLATIAALRADERFAKTPILAVTAKTMQGDRERCLAAGASDYITKPINIDQLLSLLRVWLYRGPTTTQRA
jgi:two-component system chemotaxis sensor kinase CheA